MMVRLPLLWVLGAVVVCLAGPTYASVIGVPNMPLLIAGNVYEVRAGWHFALPMAAVFLLFASFYELAPKLSGRRYNAGLGGLHLILMLAGTGLIALPQRALTLQGMPSDADAPRAFAFWNGVSAAGYFASLLGVLVFLIVIADMFFVRRKAQA